MMPPKSEKQRRFMEAIAHGAKPYTNKGIGPSKEVAQKFLSHGHKVRK